MQGLQPQVVLPAPCSDQLSSPLTPPRQSKITTCVEERGGPGKAFKTEMWPFLPLHHELAPTEFILCRWEGGSGQRIGDTSVLLKLARLWMGWRVAMPISKIISSSLCWAVKTGVPPRQRIIKKTLSHPGDWAVLLFLPESQMRPCSVSIPVYIHAV